MRRSSTLLVLAFLMLFCFPLLVLAENPPVHLTILHVNDTHGHILPYLDKSISKNTPVGGAAYLAEMIRTERLRNPDGTLLLSSGDMFQGTPVSNVFHGRPVIEVMNALKFDAMAIGNHEFDWGRERLSDLVSWAAFPFISANVLDKNGGYLPGIQPYLILTRKNFTIGIIGITTPETSYKTKPSNVVGLTFEDPVDVLPGLIQEVKKGAGLVIVLSHLGLLSDIELANRIPGIDVIVGGHSHTAVTSPVRIGKTIIVQAGLYGLYLGVLQIKVDPSKKEMLVYTKENELKTVFAGKDNAFDSNVAEIVSKYEDQVKTEFAHKVGETSVDLVRRGNEESNLGDLVCDAMREATGAEIALQTSGGIRGNLSRGKITLDEIYTVLPFGNFIVSMDLTGRQIMEALERSSDLDKGALQVSGIRVEYDIKRSAGSRVTKAEVKNGPLDPDRLYRVAINDFLAAGGDLYTVFKEGQNVLFGDNLRDVLVSYLKKHSPVCPKPETRITIVR